MKQIVIFVAQILLQSTITATETSQSTPIIHRTLMVMLLILLIQRVLLLRATSMMLLQIPIQRPSDLKSIDLYERLFDYYQLSIQPMNLLFGERYFVQCNIYHRFHKLYIPELQIGRAHV